MRKEMIYYYEAPGEINTNTTLKAVRDWAQKYSIKRVFVPSKSGQTAQKAYNLFKNAGIEMTVVGTDPNIFSSEILAQLKSNGTRVCFGGTKKGVDTALVIRPAKSENFDQLEVREIIAKPRIIKVP
jgi:hypothetical protein